MRFLYLVPPVCSFLLISAHFQRAGLTALALFCLGIPFILIIKRPLSVRFVQFAVNPGNETTNLSGICIPKMVFKRDANEKKKKSIFGQI